MIHFVAGGRRWFLLPLAEMILLTASGGCSSDGKIVTYNVPKETASPAADSTPAATGEPTDRMLAAIVPEGGQAWIYKVVGPIPAVDAQADKILEFISKVPPANGARAPSWQLPTGWTSKPGSDGFTLATIQVPSEGQPLDLSVSSLGWATPSEMLLMNVNRWRGQMGLPPHQTIEQVSQDAREMNVGDRTATVVDLKGAFRRGGMGGPFSGGTMGGSGTPGANASGATGSSRPEAGTMPADYPPIDTENSKRPVAESAEKSADAKGASQGAAPRNEMTNAPVPKFEYPASWSAMPASGMNRAVFRVADGGREALVTVSNIPASTGTSFADPLSNANMWRVGVGLPEIKSEQLADATETIEIGGRSATLVRAVPGEDRPEGTVGAIVTNGDQIWFFKFKGARQLVLDRQEEFLTFLKSVKLAD